MVIGVLYSKPVKKKTFITYFFKWYLQCSFNSLTLSLYPFFLSSVSLSSILSLFSLCFSLFHSVSLCFSLFLSVSLSFSHLGGRTLYVSFCFSLFLIPILPSALSISLSNVFYTTLMQHKGMAL
jgi:hypothetical protein